MKPDFSKDKFNILTIENFGIIKTSANGTRYRRVLYRDEVNKKTAEYILFENTVIKQWKENPVLDGNIYIDFGKILTIQLTPEIISKANTANFQVFKNEGELDIVLIGDFEKNHKPTEEEIIRALKKQIWKISRYSRKENQAQFNAHNDTEGSLDDMKTYHSSGWSDSDLRHANFTALTDGMYGDYDDFNGNWDDIDDWAGR